MPRRAGDPAVEQVILDRTVDGHDAVRDRPWDAVIDVSGYVPAVVRHALRALGTPETRWVFVSSTSVFRERDVLGQDETAPVIELDADERRAILDDPTYDWRSSGRYGACKVLCEQEVRAADVGPTAILRPCVIAGAHDSTWRFPYWVERAGRGGRIVAPAPRDAPAAVIDARDLAAFALECIEGSIDDTFVVAPDPSVVTMESIIASARAAWPDVASDVAWIDELVLREHGVEPWAGLPFWLPASTGSHGFSAFDASRARAAGFAPRPLVETASEVRRWLETTDAWPSPGISLQPALEATLAPS